MGVINNMRSHDKRRVLDGPELFCDKSEREDKAAHLHTTHPFVRGHQVAALESDKWRISYCARIAAPPFLTVIAHICFFQS
jgi:hypothetical protein